MLLESDNLLGSNSLSPFVKRVQFFESNFGNPVHFLWVMLKRVQICDFLKKNKYWQKNQFLESYSKKEWFNSVSHIQKTFNSLRQIFFKKIQLVLWVMSYVQFFESSWKERFNSVSHVQNKVNHWVLLLKKGLKMKKVQSFELYRKKRLNSLGHVKQKVQSIESIFEKVQFLESVFLSKISILRVIFSKNDQFILWVIHFAKKKKIFESYKKWVIFFDSC